MTPPSADGLTGSDSTDRLVADWDLDDPSSRSLTGPSDITDDPDGAAPSDETALHPHRGSDTFRANGSLRFLRGFSLGDPAGRGDRLREGSVAGACGETILRRGPLARSSWRPSPGTGPARVQSRPAPGLPGPGDVLAGFRILQELGRGAFARVYLAEELRLGGRLVAIKVSRAEGDEPRILARLQHAHIVPVHSVCDDPATGLRVLCMPYFGGATLARVLDATGGLTTTGHSGRGLVEALDQISRQQASASGESPRPPTAPTRPGRSTAEGPEPGPVPMDEPGQPAGLSASNASALASGFRSLLGRIIAGGAMLPGLPSGPAAGDDLHQPSRQFLRRASAVQAAAWIVARLAEGLDHAHSRGLLHRDLKPANILLAADGTPMLLDFNLAAESEPPSAGGEIGRATLGGTLPYMAPEHLDAFSPRGTTPAEAVGEPADIYALGLILFEMLAGDPPFPPPEAPPGTPPGEVIAAMIEARRHPPSLRARCPHVPWSLDALVAKCLAFDPGGRYARARDLAEDLRRYLDDRPMKHAPEPSPRERAAKFARRHPAMCSATSIATIASVLILALGAGVTMAHSAMQGLAARFHRQAFERDFTEAQFLLNTGAASGRHLAAGLHRARALFNRLELADDRPEPAADWSRHLTGDERRRLREELIELILLEARARVLLATRRGTESARQESLHRAIARLDAAERLGGRLPGALFSDRARYRAAMGDAEAAARDRDRAARTRPTTGHDWTLLGSSLLAAGDSSSAEEALRQALRIESTSFWAWFLMGHCHFAQSRFVEAAGDFAACTALGPQFAWAHFNRGLAMARSGRLDPALDAYDQALRIDPDLAEARVNRALVELELDRVESALSDLDLAIRSGRQDAGILAARGEALARLGRTDEARRQFDAMLADDPDNAVVRVARGMALLRIDAEGARADFGRVLARDPRHAAAHYGMALLIRANEPEGALAHLDRALDADPNLVDAIQLRALVRARLGQPAALDDVDRLLKIPTARRCYNAACAVALFADRARDPKQLDHAMELLRRAAELGFPAREAADDPDLASLRDRPAFRRLIEGP